MSGSDEDADLRAAEYVLGVLERAEARIIEAQAERDPALRAAIAEWEDQLAPLSATVDPVAPPPDVWARLALATGAGAAEPRSPPPSRSPSRSPSQLGALARAWRSAGLWRAATAGSLALAASFAFVATRTVEPRVAALVEANAAAPAFLVYAGADGRARVVALAPAPVAAGRDLALWALPEGAVQPASLGVLPAGGRSLTVPARPGTRLLVSLEPAGGSPTGQPTGPVLYQGVLAAAP